MMVKFSRSTGTSYPSPTAKGGGEKSSCRAPLVSPPRVSPRKHPGLGKFFPLNILGVE